MHAAAVGMSLTPRSLCPLANRPSSGKLPQLGPGEYTGWQVGKKLGVDIHHSFLVFYEGYQNAPAGEAAVEAGGPSHSDANDLADGQPARKEVL